MHNYFSYFTSDTKKDKEEGYNFFRKYINISNKSTFNSAKAFYIYYAYLLNKKNANIDDIINQLFITITFDSFEEYRDFALFCLYKGMILLQNKKYIRASFSFLMCLSKIENVITECHLHCYKRLLFLKHIVDREFAVLIHKYMNAENVFYRIEEIIPWLVFNVENDEKIYIELLKILEQKKMLEQEKLTGLAYAALFSVLNRKIMQYLRIYKRISLQNLSRFTNLKEDLILKVLQKNVANGKMNVKYDEVKKIIEVINCDVGDNSIEEIKKAYEEMMMLTKDLVVFDGDIKMKNYIISQMSNQELMDYYKNKMKSEFSAIV